MSNYITIDGGTTNTRLSLVVDHRIVETIKYSVGAGKSIEDKSVLGVTIKDGLSKLLKKNNLTPSQIKRILASGMLTSEFGIYDLAHIKVPAGIKELHDSMAEATLRAISDIPFVFVRGVKTGCENIESTDMMRGEETELMGLMDNIAEECIYVLPGSHSKVIKTDRDGKITDFSTMLTGEMISVLAKDTILRDAVNVEDATLDKDWLLNGFDYCRKYGINNALFKVRVLKNIFKRTPGETYSFYMGVVLCPEIINIIGLKPKRVIIGGKRQIKEAMFEILTRNIRAEVVRVSDALADQAATIGILKIFEFERSA